MNLHLERPIAFFDLETTGTNVATDRIVELAILKLQPGGSKTMKIHRVNPTIPISEESISIHGITDEMVKDEPTFADLAPSLFKFLFDCDLAGYNSNKFDVPLLVEEFLRAGIDFEVRDRKLVDVQNIFHKMEQRTLAAAYKFYCGQSLENAHSAEADITATFEVLESQLDRYEELSNDVGFLHEFSQRNKNADLMGRIIFNDKDEEVFNFGKYRGKSVEEVLSRDPGYYGWMMNGDFPRHTKKVMKEIRQRMNTNKNN